MSKSTPEQLLLAARTDPAIIALPLAARALWLLLMDLIRRHSGIRALMLAHLPPSAIAATLSVSETDYLENLGTLIQHGLFRVDPKRGLIAKPIDHIYAFPYARRATKTSPHRAALDAVTKF